MASDDNHDTSTGENQRPSGRSLMSRLVPKSPSAAIQPVAAPAPPPQEKRQQRPLVNFVSGLLSFVLVISIIAGGIFYFGMRQLEAPGPLASDKVVVVRGGVSDVTEQLRHEGVIDQPTLFGLGLYIKGAAGQIKAGEYLFRQNASLSDVMETLVEGKAILHSLTIPEGLTSQQIVERIAENDILTSEVRETPREGTLLPETYKFTRGMTRNQLLDRMMQDHARLVKEIWARRSADLPLKSPQELVILASIVEKETGRADERTRVAGVFVNRLNRQMRLQSDPTIVYGIVGGKGALGRSLTRADIDTATPYNTYAVAGLPPGPIGNPGRAALEAVANPSRTKELYFVADGTGGHVFAETYEQHLRNVARWRQVETDRKDPAKDAGKDTGKDAGKEKDGAAGKVENRTDVKSPPAADAADATAVITPSETVDLPLNPPLPPVPPASLRKTSVASGSATTRNGAAKADTVEAPTGDISNNFDLNSPKTVPKLD